MPLLTPASSSAAAKRLPALPNLPDLPDAHDARTLRIALVTEYYYPHLGGVCEHVHFFAREARRRGHHVDIITSKGTSSPGVVAYQNLLHLGQARHEWLKKLLNSLRAQAGAPVSPVEEDVLAGV